MALSDLLSTVERLVRDQSQQITTPDRERALAAALRQLSNDAPRQLVREVTWQQAGYEAALPADMEPESRILNAEYPVGLVPPAQVQVAVQLTLDDGASLMCTQALATGSVVRITFTAAHQVADVPTPVSTVPARLVDAVCMLAASHLCRELATYFSGERESSIGADQSNTESRARNYAARAAELRAQYFAAVGTVDPVQAAKRGGSGGSGGGMVAAAGAVATWPSRGRLVARPGVG